ncbi:Cilia- and flagella-associated protein 57 [Channa argus]|uniref:Cilia-and flagella-associated protein 57 n=1 Tax=Channa argus TaxID=215402 RepID=A0A6G1PGM4_CHAAH|nr:Cilia- and flagella-associated protein 57 [Channa argus]
MATVVAQAHFVFGLRAGVANNVCFVDEQTVVFPSGNNCVCYNTIQRCQRFIPGSEKSMGMRALAISANRRYLAVSECGEKATITVFDLQHEQGRKRKVLTAGEILVQEFVCMAFSPDSKYLIGQTGGPDWMLIFWLWEKQKVLASVKTSNSNNPITQVSFNPYNNMQLCVSGTGVFKLFRYSEGTLKQSSFAKVETINFLCHTWMTEEQVIAGTDTGRLLVFESGDLRREISINSKTVQEQPLRQVETRKITDVGEPFTVSHITAIQSFSKGFVCSVGPGTVCLFEKTDDDGYRKSREIQIPSDPYSNEVTLAECQDIDTMCISPAEETLAISTDQGQLYSVNLSSVDMHRLSLALYMNVKRCQLWRSILLGRKATFRIPVPVLPLKMYHWFIHLHPEALCGHMLSGPLYPYLELRDKANKLSLMNLVIDDIRTFKDFTVRGCRECAFSHGGHMFAAVNGNVIHIYSFTAFENILNLKAHNGKVRGIDWSLDDSHLVSCGMDGAVYTWNTQTGKRESESVLKSCSYTGVAFSSDCKTILAVGSDRTLKEIQDGQVLREVPADEVAHTAVAVSHSGRVVFSGTSSGTIRAIKYPLPIQKEWIMYQAHCGPITKMLVTFDDQFLLTVSEDGCLIMWRIIDKEGRGLKSNRQIVHSEEILVTKSDLEDKARNMLELKMHLEELQMENEYQLRLKDMNYNEKLKEISDKFTQQIESLKTTQQAMKVEMEKQELEHRESFAEVTVKHAKELKDLELSYSQKLITEHERYQEIQQKYQQMQEDHEKQLKSNEESRIQALEELRQHCEAKLQEKIQLLAQVNEQEQKEVCQEDAQQQICEYKEIIKQVEEDEERKIHDIQIKYEKKLHTEKEANTNLKGETGIMTQKFYTLQRQIEERGTDINKLKQERQRLLGLIRSLESDIEDLKRQIAGHEKTNQDKDNTIASLKKKNQELEKLRFVLDFQFNELKKQTEPQQDEITEKRKKINQLEEELVQIDKSNTQLKLSVSELRHRLKTREKDMYKEMQKVKDLETHLQRLKSDLHNCVGFIQDPRKLKDSVQIIYARYVTQTNGLEKSSLAEDIQRVFCRQRDHLERTVNALKMRLAKSAEEHDKVYIKIMKENVTLITEINELRKELRSAKTQVKDYKTQMATMKKSQPNSEEGLKKEPNTKMLIN